MEVKGLRQVFRDLVNEVKNQNHPVLGELIQNAYFHHHWFTVREILRRLQAIDEFLSSEDFEKHYAPIEPAKPIEIALYSEENIPLEEFFTVIVLLALGHRVQYRGGNVPDKVFRWIIEYLQQGCEFAGKIQFVENQFAKFDKMILATRFPWPEKNLRLLHQKHDILALSRYQSVAVITDNITEQELSRLARDFFCYFGMGCENVRKIYVPEGFDFELLFKAVEEWYEPLFNHHTYMNNYQYHQSVYLMNKIPHRDNGFLLLKEDEQMRAPTGVLFYEFYSDERALREQLGSAAEIYRVFVSKPENGKEKPYGDSVNQLFLPQEAIIEFVR